MNYIFGFLQEHFSKEVPEGVSVHFFRIDTTMFTPYFQML